MQKTQAVGLSRKDHNEAQATFVKVNQYDLFLLLDYIILLGEKKDYQENCCPKNHIWHTAKRIMKAVNYKE